LNAIPPDKPASQDKPFALNELEPFHCSYWAPIFTPEKIGLLARVSRFGRRWIARPISPEEEEARKEAKDPEKICQTRPKSTVCDEFKADRILTIFQQQETAVLNQSADRTDGLRQLHERIVVLRGTIFSGFVLLLICIFAFFARVNGESSHWIRPAFGGVLALAFTAFAACNGYQDLVNRNIFDIPVFESLVVVITIFGVALALRRAKNESFHSKRYILITLFFTGLAYGGWMWSEIIYDQQVMSSYVVLQQNPPPNE
jgi:cation transport ATPase